ncbi:LuxR C-terminal-related transcriptional regulator [Acidisoma sp.]|uniref:LuxR C-terminal-related transcriptional regulator n=1 Tax=Acidisoma sp. TaxID=1872115 RepID=UPI003AFF85FD
MITGRATAVASRSAETGTDRAVPDWTCGDRSIVRTVSLAKVLAVTQSRPALGHARSIRRRIACAWGRLLALDVEGAIALVRLAELDLSGVEAPLSAELRTRITIIRAAAAAWTDDFATSLAFAQRALPGRGAAPGPSIAVILCRLAHWKLGHLGPFYAMKAHATEVAGPRGADLLVLDRSIEAASELQRLRLGVAGILASQALSLTRRARRRRIAATDLFPVVLQAQLHYERGDLPEAEDTCRKALSVLKATGPAEAAIRLFILLAKVEAHRLHTDYALLILREGEALGRSRGWERLVAACVQECVEVLVHCGRIDEAQDCLARTVAWLAPDTVSRPARPAVHMHLHLAGARIALATAPSAGIVLNLRLLHHEAAAGGDLYLALRLAIRVAEALEATGETAEASETLARCLDLGASAGLYQSFIDGGPVIGRLLARFLDQSGEGEEDRQHLRLYVESILSGWRSVDGERRLVKSLKSSGCLSPRECTILRLYRRGESTKGVARQLTISPETVKSHAKHIFVKLSAQSRTEAVQKAEHLGLI